MGLLIAFFLSNDQRADRLSNLAFLLFYALAAAVVYEVHQRYAAKSPLVVLATVVALAALAFLFVSQALVTLGRMDLRRLAVLQTVGFATYVLWTLAASAMVLAFGRLPASLGWLGVAAVVAALAVLGWFARDPALIKGDRPPNRMETTVMTLPFLGISAWLVWLGLSI